MPVCWLNEADDREDDYNDDDEHEVDDNEKNDEDKDDEHDIDHEMHDDDIDCCNFINQKVIQILRKFMSHVYWSSATIKCVMMYNNIIHNHSIW